MLLHPTHRKRIPYLFHFEGQTVALGDPKFLFALNDLLLTAGVSTRPTFWDPSHFADHPDEFFSAAQAGADRFGGANENSLLNSVGVALEQEDFWSAVEKGVFKNTEWPIGNAPLFMPETPDWLQNARAWEFDPVLPPAGPGGMGGWDRVRGRSGSGQPLGLFQLTSEDSFWVLGSAEDLESVIQLCRELAQTRTGFELATAFIGQEGTYSCLALPIDCHVTLEEELFLAGIDTESLFWE